jgi:hypothetical protein
VAAQFLVRGAGRGSSANSALEEGVRHGLIFRASLPAPTASPSSGRKGPCRSPGTVRARDRRRERRGRHRGPRPRPSVRLNGEGARAAHAGGCRWEERPPPPHGCRGGREDGGDGNFRRLNARAPRNLEERGQGLCCRRPHGRCRAPRSPPPSPPTRSGDRRRRHCAPRRASLKWRRRPPLAWRAKRRYGALSLFVGSPPPRARMARRRRSALPRDIGPPTSPARMARRRGTLSPV